MHLTHTWVYTSPDGIVECGCCGRGVVEIKCPYSCRDKTFLETTREKCSFLELVDGKQQLKRNHTYYYQVQAQMKFCQCLYCDFVAWSENDIVIERIVPDTEFIESALEKATIFSSMDYCQNFLENTTQNCHLQQSI